MKKIDYPFIPEGREIFYVGEDNEFMRAAKEECLSHSTDMNQPTGSVAVLNGKIIGKASNQARIKHKKFAELHKRMLCVRKLLKVKTGTKYWLCPGCAKFSDHSEARAVKDAKRNGYTTAGADLYLYGHWWCCEPCWNAMIEGGIKNVYLLEGSEELFVRKK